MIDRCRYVVCPTSSDMCRWPPVSYAMSDAGCAGHAGIITPSTISLRCGTDTEEWRAGRYGHYEEDAWSPAR